MKNILVVDDEPAIRDLVQMVLTREGYRVTVVPDGQTALDLLRSHKPDLIVLDLMLPDMSGHEVCKKVTEQYQIPIIMLTAKHEVVDKVLGLEFGADDYITKPFDARELLARIKALLRRLTKQEDSGINIIYQGLEINLANKTVYKNGELISLTPREFQLLEVLATHHRRTFSRDDLMSLAWGYEYSGDSRAVDIHITRLRKKIEDDSSQPRYIVTVYGFGYRFGGV
ncbi:response regulator transcription factor [Desulforamulus aeronauticus]|uniref:Stage 0 sporulation protein A homolog n=1 Tax=Desulforamulus aeronauticus DSM 10349 TaxID=1121421 RepID=A0A1M6RZ40_9FIRM|nr:response regulator transcription factor [Desulforamulus aeronauticus]SHK37569.1 two-component system, OmpR family, response regulator VicR [Desulforamulus aeronauticus DSM 10349]